MVKLLVFILITITSANTISCPKIRNRHKWGGREALSVDYQIIPVQYVIIHHTVSNKCSRLSTCAEQVANIQNYHMTDLGYGDIGYNFLIGNDGNIYEGVGWNKIGAHTRGYNSKSIGIAFIGNFNDELPTIQALQAAKDLLAYGVATGMLSRNYTLLGGRQVISTESPGLELYNEIQDWDHWAVKP